MLKNNLNELSTTIFNSNHQVGWWSQEDIDLRNEFWRTGKMSKGLATLISSKIALCHSELSEALEGMRKNLMDDHLPHRDMMTVEFADTKIRILDICGFLGLDIGGAVSEKYEYNQIRADHKKENREASGGKTI